MTVGIIIPTRGHFDYAARSIRSALINALDAIALVIDDASPEWSESLAGRLIALGPPGRTILERYEEQEGLTRSWNAGLALCRRLNLKFAVCANSDLIFPPGWWPPLAHALDDDGFDFVGPLTNAPGHSTNQDVRRCMTSYETSDDPPAIVAMIPLLEGKPATPSRRLNGFCFAGRTSAFFDCSFDGRNVFNPSIRLAGNEDEFFRRARRQGKRLGIAAASFVFHYRGVTRGLGASKPMLSHGAFRSEDKHADSKRRPSPCVHLGRVIARHGKSCPRCWDRRCDLLATTIQLRRECETCRHYEAES